MRSFGVRPILTIITYDDDIGLVAALLKHGADPNNMDEGGRTPLIWALIASYNPDKTVDLLLRNGASATLVDETGASPLEYAYVRQRDFLHVRNRGKADTLAAFMPHVSFIPHVDLQDATQLCAHRTA